MDYEIAFASVMLQCNNMQEGGRHWGRHYSKESAMIKGTTPSFEIPNEMRAVAERSVEQAKLAFNNYMQAALEAVSTFEERVKASQSGAQGISKKAMTFAERNVLSAFEFAQKIVQAKDIQELVRMQTEFVQSQMQVLSEQVKDLGETATKTAMESVKTPSKEL
jgi:phasin